MAIKILNNSIINKIAAGEVVERPASVVKEILENSFDAGATEVKIEIINGGLKKIKIIDNGIGMNEEDCVLSIQRHTTSKIENENDLFDIHSLGFRGEALSSIAEVSNLKIITKKQEDPLGTLMEVEAGKTKKIEPTVCSNGTTIEVNDLFFNVPVRREYLKSPEVEFANIVRIVSRYSLIKKYISIILTHNGREIINSEKTDSSLNNIIFIYGAEIGKDLIKVDYEKDNLIVRGFISKPSLTRAEKHDQSIYINDRFVKDKIVTDSVYEAYKTLLFINRHPIFILDIELSAQEVDVNVHPSKEIVKFKDEKKIRQGVYEAINEALKNANLIRDTELDVDENTVKILKPELNNTKRYEYTFDKQTNLFEEKIRNDRELKEEIERKSLIVKDEERKSIFSGINILGQINKTYIVCESVEGLVLFDQHAAEERINYEKFMKDYKINALKKQSLLEGRIIELNPEQKQIALNNRDFLESLGFVFEDFGGNSIKLYSIPEILGRLKSTIFIDVVNELIKNKITLINEEIEKRIIRFACRASVKAGEERTIGELKNLIKELGTCENPYSCPHGRPTVIKITISELEKKFKRTGW